MPLTDLAIRKAAPRSKAYKLSDGHGLYLLISPSGSKLWYQKFRYDSKENRIAPGAYPSITLRDARELQLQVRATLDKGSNPAEQRREEKRGAVPQHTFKSVALVWLVSNRTWSEEHAERVKR
ncbi:Arm DNA-binding domain-containing protein [Pantoea sp. B65]